MELNSFLEQLKSKINIVEIAGRYMTLTRKGNKYWGCCPFHHERTPSFAVDEIKQFYYCFGCHESGDVIKFVQNVESTDFMGAIGILANIAGIEVPQFSGKNNEEAQELKKRREKAYALLKDAALFYNKQISAPSQSAKLQYLLNRGITKSTITRFGLGASPDWTSVIKYLKEKGYSEEEMVEAGVAGKDDEGKVYDAYGMRIMIPIIDSYGQVVAFGGRTMDKHAQAKYKNTGDTIAFNKRKVLYGLNLVKKNKLKEAVKSIILVEGYMDAIAVYDAGFHNVVASMGTALTKEQAKLIHYITEDCYICYDGDAAGVKGAVLGQKIMEEEGINAKIVILRDNLDPDEILRKYGKEEYQKALDGALTGTEFKFKILSDKFNIKDSIGKKKYLENALRIIASLTTEAEKEEWLNKTADLSGISVSSLRSDLAKVESGEVPEKVVERTIEAQETDTFGRAIRYLLCSCIDGRKTASDIAFCERHLVNGTHRKIYDYLKSKDGEKINGSMLFNVLDEDEYPELTAVLEIKETEGITSERDDGYFKDCVSRFKTEDILEEIEMLKSLYVELVDAGEKRRTVAKIAELTQKLKRGDRSGN